MNPPADRKHLLSVLWIFVVLNYIYADLFMLIFDPESYHRAGASMIELTVFSFAVLMEALIAMVLLSRILRYRLNRWANIFAGLLGTAAVAFTLRGGAPFHYVFFASVEMACTLFIVWYAWTWRAA
jgi:hypothetical protein